MKKADLDRRGSWPLAAGAFFLLGGREQGGAEVPDGRWSSKGNVTQTVAATGHALGRDDGQGRQRRLGQRRGAPRRLQQAGQEGRAPGRARSRCRSRRRSTRARRALEKAQVDARNAEIALRRQKALWDAGARGAGRPRPGAGELRLGRGARSSRRRRRSTQAQTDLRNSRIVAPIDGVVVDRAVRRRADASPRRSGADDLHDRAGPDEDAGLGRRLRVRHRPCARSGSPCASPSTPTPTRRFRGKIAQIRLNATVNQNVVTYPVIIEVAEPGPGAAAEHDRQRHDRRRDGPATCSAIPNAALRFRPEDGRARPRRPPARRRRSARRRSGGGARAAGRRARRRAARQFDRAPAGGKAPPGRARRSTRSRADGLGEPKPVEIRAGHHRRPLHAGRRRASSRRATPSSSAS